MDQSDADLMARWQRGDDRAFADLVARWQGPMARFLTHLAGPAAPVHDLCQEVFLRVLDAGPRYREEGTFAPWLYRIALNVARDAGRRQRRQPLSLNNGEPPGEHPTPDALCERRELDGLVARAVAELPAALRLVLVLRHYEDLSFEQIARLTGTPVSTLKSRFAVALQRLRQRLHRLGPAPEERTP